MPIGNGSYPRRPTKAILAAREASKGCYPLFSGKDRPKRFLSFEEVRKVAADQPDVVALVDKGLVLLFEDQDGTVRICLTRAGLDAAERSRTVRP